MQSETVIRSAVRPASRRREASKAADAC